MTYEEKLRIFLHYIGEMMLTTDWDFKHVRNKGLVEKLFHRKESTPRYSNVPDHPDIPQIYGDWWVDKEKRLTLTDLNHSIFGLGMRGMGNRYKTAKGLCDPLRHEIASNIDVSEYIELDHFTHVTEHPAQHPRRDPQELYDFPIFGADLTFVSKGAPEYWEEFVICAKVEISFPGDYYEIRSCRDKDAHLKFTDIDVWGPKDALSKCVDTEFQYNDRRGNTLSEIGSSVKERIKFD